MSHIPVVSELKAVYATGVAEGVAAIRYKSLVDAFKSRFGVDPSFLARSPGRVNIIGEHIDYCGFSVLPMAVDRDVVIAVHAEPNTDPAKPSEVTLTNISSDKYKDAVFYHSVNNSNVIDIDSSIHAWSNYFKCGYKGIHEELALKTSPPHLKVMVSGNVPAGAGMSSSSAFVCATAVAVAHSCGAKIEKTRLTEAAIRGERYAGVQTGGMDQSISIMASPSSALLIDFYPSLYATPVLIPPQTRPYKFVVANSLVTADKHVTAAKNYNLRVLETRVAARLLGAWVGTPTTSKQSAKSLREVLDWYMESQVSGVAEFTGSKNEALIKGLGGLERVAMDVFEDGAYSCQKTLEALQSKFGPEAFAAWKDVEREFCSGIGNVFLDGGLQIKNRIRHVLSEARRVLEFVQVCSGKEAGQSADILESLGKLMNASQKSCAGDFNCSCPELDELTALCLASGAVGSRLTGAGWGGCTVSLVPEEKVEAFIAKVVEGYYAKREIDLSLVGDWIFGTVPGSGAAVLEGLQF